jgi:hypothetical protein
MVYWAAVFIMTRRLTRYENRENGRARVEVRSRSSSGAMFDMAEPFVN